MPRSSADIGKFAEPFPKSPSCQLRTGSVESMPTSFICQSCRTALRAQLKPHGPVKRSYTRPSFAPKPIVDLKHIRQNPGLYQQNCLDRNYPAAANNSWRILDLHNQLVERQKETLELRRRNNDVGKSIQRQAGMGDDAQGGGAGGTSALLEEARKLKEELRGFEEWEGGVVEEMVGLAMEVPNLSSGVTPVGDEAEVIGWINGQEPATIATGGGRSHVDIGKDLDILDFEASATTSGWGWYFLKNEGAMLEQALIQFALHEAMARGWKVMTPPSLVYEHIASACGFMPRDQNGETQRYEIAGESGSQANKTLKTSELPLKVIGPSRCYRAEAGARGVDTKGLYRVHEFTKVEMFAWTAPPVATSHDEASRFGTDEESESQTDTVFEEMLSLQTHILTELGLHAKVLEMPTTDLGAAAARKVDIEAFFPSRTSISNGYGELTSASICTDYQSRRLATRLKYEGKGAGKLGFPHTLNGTALAVPRVLACMLENGWDEKEGFVRVPECLMKWMPGNITTIGPRSKDAR
ncbi:Serine--tRNA ligase, mitochondrial [Vermiconidia calcicola]|uniref:Serine--tRNA ligase, mitochondrial n=1 Tax=Vermiconidia calcicola TaxID=1690605 RepID=A0ACC3MWT8_9PEZI|nr:Serine--tRNA ligase, mitochondrial [Vermiconidia calcicola]